MTVTHIHTTGIIPSSVYMDYLLTKEYRLFVKDKDILEILSASMERKPYRLLDIAKRIKN